MENSRSAAVRVSYRKSPCVPEIHLIQTLRNVQRLRVALSHIPLITLKKIFFFNFFSFFNLNTKFVRLISMKPLNIESRKKMLW